LEIGDTAGCETCATSHRRPGFPTPPKKNLKKVLTLKTEIWYQRAHGSKTGRGLLPGTVLCLLGTQ
jgi:hypothetical protein